MQARHQEASFARLTSGGPAATATPSTANSGAGGFTAASTFRLDPALAAAVNQQAPQQQPQAPQPSSLSATQRIYSAPASSPPVVAQASRPPQRSRSQ